jgi:serine/threonine protein kinase
MTVHVEQLSAVGAKPATAELQNDFLNGIPIGAGSFGAVRLVQRNGGEYYAVKKVAPMDVDVVREIEGLRLVEGSAFVNELHAVYYSDDGVYLVLEWVGPTPPLLTTVAVDLPLPGAGQDRLAALRSHMANHHTDLWYAVHEIKLPPSRVRSILLQLAMAVERIHRAGLAHRDIKSENVGMRMDFHVVDGHVVEQMVPVVLDFGLCVTQEHLAADQAAGTGPKGTLETSAPEMILARSNRAAWNAMTVGDVQKADMYSFGILGYAMLTGKQAVPPKLRNVDAILQRMWNLRNTLLRQSDLDPRVSDAVMAMLNWEPSQRPTAVRVVQMMC